jgi:hypothetical protein
MPSKNKRSRVKKLTHTKKKSKFTQQQSNINAADTLILFSSKPVIKLIQQQIGEYKNDCDQVSAFWIKHFAAKKFVKPQMLYNALKDDMQIDVCILIVILYITTNILLTVVDFSLFKKLLDCFGKDALHLRIKRLAKSLTHNKDGVYSWFWGFISQKSEYDILYGEIFDGYVVRIYEYENGVIMISWFRNEMIHFAKVRWDDVLCGFVFQFSSDDRIYGPYTSIPQILEYFESIGHIHRHKTSILSSRVNPFISSA